jgi:alkylation response protein AidB-like acyl-CoA dehydrogenase
MRWELSEEQELFRDSFRDWLGEFASAETVRKWLDAGESESFEERFVADGWFGVGSPEESGGQGGGLLELALTAEQLGRAAAPSGAWLASVLTIPALTGLPEISASILGEREFSAFAAHADRPLDAPGPVRFADGRLTGEVRTVLGGDRARWLLVPSGGSLYLVDAKEDGVSRSSRKLLDRSRSVADVRFDGAPARKLDVDAGRVLADAALRAAVLVAADSLGAAERMLELAVDYSLQRKQFGVPIGSFQAMKHAAATMLVTVESSRSITYFAAASVDLGQDEAPVYAATAKAQVTPAAERAADSALTMHGAIGYTWEHDLQFLYKRAKLNKPLFGAPSVWNERLAAALPLVPAA